ncbi:MAG: hypothetical protein ACE5DK_10495, partial [Paracoccaceae bacterium]
YMTGGVAVILGMIGANFGAGMTGGMAYVYDEDGTARDLINQESVVVGQIQADHWEQQVRELIQRHFDETRSKNAQKILHHWEKEKTLFLQICPKEMLPHLKYPLSPETERAASA